MHQRIRSHKRHGNNRLAFFFTQAHVTRLIEVAPVLLDSLDISEAYLLPVLRFKEQKRKFYEWFPVELVTRICGGDGYMENLAVVDVIPI